MTRILFFLLSFLIIQSLIAQESPTEAPASMNDEFKGASVFQENGKSGIKDAATGEIILPAEYRYIKEEIKNHFILYTENHRGLFHAAQRRMIVPLEYDKVEVSNDRGNDNFKNDSSFVILITRNNLQGLLDYKGNTIFPLEYTRIVTRKNYVCLTKEAKSGIYFFDPALKAIPMEYDHIAEEFPSGYFIAKKENGYFLFDKQGNLITGNNKLIDSYESAWPTHLYSLILVVNDRNAYGVYATKEKRFILPVNYDWIGDASFSEFIVKRNKKFGMVNDKGKAVVPLKYDTLAYLNPKKQLVRLKASRKNKYALITASNKSLSPFAYDDIESMNGFYKVKLGNGYSVIDSLGKRITSAVYDHIGSFHNGRCAVFLDNKYGFIDTNGKVVTPIEQSSKARGYTTLPDLFTAFVKALKSENDSILLEFCKDVVVDEHTHELMVRMNYDYRGFPKRGNKVAPPIDQIVNAYYKDLKDYRDRLKSRGYLESLVFTGLEDDKVVYWERGLSNDVLGTELYGIMKSNHSTHRYQLGELLYLDGYWKTFTNSKG